MAASPHLQQDGGLTFLDCDYLSPIEAIRFEHVTAWCILLSNLILLLFISNIFIIVFLFYFINHGYYRYCKICQLWTFNSAPHCKICNKCPSHDGQPYNHCDQCGVCIRQGRIHCIICSRCLPPQHICRQQALASSCDEDGLNAKRSKCNDVTISKLCFLCRHRGHDVLSCPDRQSHLEAIKSSVLHAISTRRQIKKS